MQRLRGAVESLELGEEQGVWCGYNPNGAWKRSLRWKGPRQQGILIKSEFIVLEEANDQGEKVEIKLWCAKSNNSEEVVNVAKVSRENR